MPTVHRVVMPLVALVAALAAPRGAGAQVPSIQRTIHVGGRDRSYILDLPPGDRASPLPIVFVFHGGGGNAQSARTQTRMSDLAAAKGFIVVYPNGTGRFGDRLLTWNTGSCCGNAQRNRVDDVAFIRTLLDSLERTYPIDPGRVYATGLSNGGMMAYLMGCALSDRFAAIAPVSGELSMRCAPTRPVSVLIIHGTADENLPYDGGVGRKALDKHDVKPVHYALERWLRFDRCGATPRIDSTPALVHRTYAPCAGGTAVELYTIVGGGHAWPGGERLARFLDAPSHALDATSVIWNFFAAHHAPVH
ncbi:MAG TPA: PHB depolymerase family esterase [Gemmatimonadaceae bacterium]|nr:PHB depolymerase family esterase [Gemmatimonadaceae bacterium]